MSNEFWVTNITKADVSLGDLRVKVPKLSSINLLDSKHYNYNLEQLLKSAESGSLFKRRDKIKIRQVAPDNKFQPGKYDISSKMITIPFRKKWSQQVIHEETYEELDVSTHDIVDQLTNDDE